MAKGWVGTIAAIMLVSTLIGPGAGATSFKDDFQSADGTGWDLLSGTASFESSSDNWAGHLLTWLALEGVDETSVPEEGRIVIGAERVAANWSSYRLSAIIERDGDAGSPGSFGITFGETAGQGYYLAAFDDDGFVLGAPDGATGGTSILLTQEGWGDVPDHALGVDKRLRYVLEVEGTVLNVKVNGWPMGTYLLPGTAAGSFGFLVSEDTTVHVQEVTYTFLDRTPPEVEIYRPVDGIYYVQDIAIPIFATGLTMASGILTLGADIYDPNGVKDACLLIDGKMVPGTRTSETGAETRWEIDTTELAAGFHNVTVVAQDHSGNIGTHSVEVLVVSDRVTTETVHDVASAVEHLIP